MGYGESISKPKQLMENTIIRKKVRGSNRISTVKIKRVRGETTLHLKVCEQIAELFKGLTSVNSENLTDAHNNPIKVYNRTDRWNEIVEYFNETGRKENFYVSDTRDRELIQYGGGSTPTLSVYTLRTVGIENGVEIKLTALTTLAGLEQWADKLNSLLSGFYRNYIEKVEIEATLRKPSN